MISSQTLAALLTGLTLSGAAKLRVSPQALADELSANEEVLVNPVASKVCAAWWLERSFLRNFHTCNELWRKTPGDSESK